MDENKKKSIEGYILFMLNRRDYSEKELRDRLQNKKYYDESIADTVIERFKELKYISDERCVESLVHSQYSALYGVNKIKQKCFTRGLGVESVVLECEDYDFFDTCLQYLKKKIKNKDDLNDYKNKQKIINKLISRGFTFQEINFAIDEVMADH